MYKLKIKGMALARQESLGQLVTQLHLLGGSASRSELTERLGCGRSVMGYLLGELVDRGVVSIDRGGRAPPGAEAGRPSHQVSLAAAAPVVVAVLLETDRVSVATVGLGGRILGHTDLSFGGPPASVDELVGTLAGLIAEQARGQRRVLGAGMAVPSPVRSSDGLAFALLHLGLPSVPLREALATRLARDYGLGGLRLELGNDANLAALAEHRHGAGRDARQLLYLTTGRVGLGGALITDGRLFGGAHGYAMELGHITVDPAGVPCACGSSGCLEVETDHRGLLRAAGGQPRDATDDARAAAAVLAAAQAGDRAALAAVTHVTGRLGNGLASLVNLTDPDRVVLAGSLASYARLAPEALASHLAARSFLNHADPIPIVPGELPDPALLGAADLAFQPLLDDPRAELGRLDE